LRIRSAATLVASGGGPTTSRFNAWPTRPGGVGGVWETLVVRIGGSCPSGPATGTNRVNRAGRTWLASGYSPRDGPAGSRLSEDDRVCLRAASADRVAAVRLIAAGRERDRRGRTLAGTVHHEP